MIPEKLTRALLLKCFFFVYLFDFIVFLTDNTLDFNVILD